MSNEPEPRRAETSVAVRWFGEFGLQAEAADAVELASAIDDFIRTVHRAALDQRKSDIPVDSRYLIVSPKAGAMFSVQLYPPTTDRAVLTARIPPGPAGRRAALASIGWAIERASSGTPYYTRHFDQLDIASQVVVRAIVEAYQLLYGQRAKGLRWHVSVELLLDETAGSVQAVPGAVRDWLVQVAGTPYHIVLGEGLRSFSVDGVEHSLGGIVHLGPRTEVFHLGGQASSITSTQLAPTMGAQLWRRITRGRLGGLLGIIRVSILLGPAAGAGVSAARGVEWLVWGWTIYDLRVNGESQGSWVYTNGGEHGFSGWVYVPPGGALPQRDWINWPTLPAPTEREISRNRLVVILLLGGLLLFFAILFGFIYFRGS